MGPKRYFSPQAENHAYAPAFLGQNWVSLGKKRDFSGIPPILVISAFLVEFSEFHAFSRFLRFWREHLASGRAPLTFY